MGRRLTAKRLICVLVGGIVALLVHFNLLAYRRAAKVPENGEETRWENLEKASEDWLLRDPLKEDSYQPGMDLLVQVNIPSP